MTVDTSAPTTWTLTLKQDGNALSGQMKIGETRSAPTFDLTGTIQDRKFAINFQILTPDGINQPIAMSGEVDGDTIKGAKSNFWDAGEGPWTAKKKASE